MRLSDSAHLDTFCRDRLPPLDHWPEFRFDLPELNYPERLNCAAELLDTTAARDGADRPCLLSPTETWTYGETVRRTNQVARVLTEDFGLQPGNRVMLRGPNSPWLAAAWLAVIKAGGVAVTTMALLRPREIATVVGWAWPRSSTAGTAPMISPPAARPRTARSRRSIPPPTTWPCSRRPRAPPASR